MKAQEDLLKLICFLLPDKNNFPKSLPKLKPEIGMDKIELQTKEYCERCKFVLPENKK